MNQLDYEQWTIVPRASGITGFPAWKIYAAIRARLIPCKTLLNSRKYVRVIDIESAMRPVNGVSDVTTNFNQPLGSQQ